MATTRLINLRTFELEPFIIEQMPPYVATSHVWSESLFSVSAKPSISVAPGMRMVAAVIQSLKDADRPEYCWVDTLCIDQSDPDDKLRQIPLMGVIYRNAQLVIITVNYTFTFSQNQWDSAITACKEILEVQRLPGDEYQASPQRLGCLTIPSVRGLFQAYAMMIEIASLPWASRIWTAQEYILAQSEIFIGADNNAVLVAIPDMMTIFAARWSRRDILAMFESYIVVPQDFTTEEESAAENFDLMNRIKQGRVHAVKSMLLAGPRKCTVKEDEIYGLMGASGVVFNPSATETLDSAWARWWEESLKSGNLFYSLLPTLEDDESVKLDSWNCIMPPTDKRCELGTKTHTHNAESWGDTGVKDGTLSVLGRNAGVCHIDRYLCDDEIPEDLDGMSKLCGPDEDLALKICLAVDMGQRSRSEITTVAQSICAFYQLSQSSNQLDETEMQRLKTLIEQFEPSPFRLQCYTKVYLGHLTNAINTTNILIITGEKLPTTGTILALDLIKRIDTEHPSKQLMLVWVPDDPGLPLHKVGMTYPIQLHESEYNIEDCPCNGHVHCEPLQRYRVGGRTCEYCNQRRN